MMSEVHLYIVRFVNQCREELKFVWLTMSKLVIPFLTGNFHLDCGARWPGG